MERQTQTNRTVRRLNFSAERIIIPRRVEVSREADTSREAEVAQNRALMLTRTPQGLSWEVNFYIEENPRLTVPGLTTFAELNEFGAESSSSVQVISDQPLPPTADPVVVHHSPTPPPSLSPRAPT